MTHDTDDEKARGEKARKPRRLSKKIRIKRVREEAAVDEPGVTRDTRVLEAEQEERPTEGEDTEVDPTYESSAKPLVFGLLTYVVILFVLVGVAYGLSLFLT